MRDGRFVEDVLTACGFLRLNKTGAGDIRAPKAWWEEVEGKRESPDRTWDRLSGFGGREGGLQGGLRFGG